MDQFIGTKKGQCHGDDKLFYKWILCCFGYWNTQYSKAGMLSSLTGKAGCALRLEFVTFVMAQSLDRSLRRLHRAARFADALRCARSLIRSPAR